MILAHMLGVRREHQRKLLTSYTLAYICPTSVHVCVPPLGPLRSSPSPTAVKPVPAPPRQNNAAAARKTTSVTRNGVDAEVLVLSQQVALPYSSSSASMSCSSSVSAKANVKRCLGESPPTGDACSLTSSSQCLNCTFH